MNKIELYKNLMIELAKSKKPALYMIGFPSMMSTPAHEENIRQECERLSAYYNVINPFNLIDFESHWLEVRKKQVILLASAEYAWFAEGWEENREAKYLHQIAILLHISPIKN